MCVSWSKKVFSSIFFLFRLARVCVFARLRQTSFQLIWIAFSVHGYFSKRFILRPGVVCCCRLKNFVWTVAQSLSLFVWTSVLCEYCSLCWLFGFVSFFSLYVHIHLTPTMSSHNIWTTQQIVFCVTPLWIEMGSSSFYRLNDNRELFNRIYWSWSSRSIRPIFATLLNSIGKEFTGFVGGFPLSLCLSFSSLVSRRWVSLWVCSSVESENVFTTTLTFAFYVVFGCCFSLLLDGLTAVSLSRSSLFAVFHEFFIVISVFAHKALTRTMRWTWTLLDARLSCAECLRVEKDWRPATAQYNGHTYTHTHIHKRHRNGRQAAGWDSQYDDGTIISYLTLAQNLKFVSLFPIHWTAARLFFSDFFFGFCCNFVIFYSKSSQLSIFSIFFTISLNEMFSVLHCSLFILHSNWNEMFVHHFLHEQRSNINIVLMCRT